MLLNVDEYCDVRYGLRGKRPTKAQRNTVSQMCRTGTLNAFKSGKRWLIRLEDGSVESKGRPHAAASAQGLASPLVG